MLRLRKVYVCDCCGDIEAPRYSGWPNCLHKKLPYGWEKIAGKTLCSRCAQKYKAYDAMTHSKKLMHFDNGIFIPYAKYEINDDFINDQMIVRKVK